jgi:hypothetical protein
VDTLYVGEPVTRNGHPYVVRWYDVTTSQTPESQYLVHRSLRQELALHRPLALLVVSWAHSQEDVAELQAFTDLAAIYHDRLDFQHIDIWADPSLGAAWGLRTHHAQYLVDSSGVVRYAHLGDFDELELDDAIQGFLANYGRPL